MAIPNWATVPQSGRPGPVTRRSDRSPSSSPSPRPSCSRPVLRDSWPGSRRAQRRELQLVLLMPGSPSEEERTRRAYLGAAANVDGALLVSPHGDDPMPNCSVEARYPCSRRWPAERGAQVSYVDVDNEGRPDRGWSTYRPGSPETMRRSRPTDHGRGIDTQVGRLPRSITEIRNGVRRPRGSRSRPTSARRAGATACAPSSSAAPLSTPCSRL